MLALALAATTLAPSAKADEWNKQTVVTVRGGGVLIQGTVLEPGNYVFKLADSQYNRRILQIFNAADAKLETTIVANPAYRLNSTGDTRFTFDEMQHGQPPAISTWFYPGDNYGLQFSER